MALAGTAFLALWNDFEQARYAEYECWHTFEHVPERVGIDGVLSGRRYVARERDDRRWFTLYELASLAALEGQAYLDVVEHPTPWTLSMRPSFRNFLRRPCTTEVSAGQGHGAAIATLRIVAAEVPAAAACRAALEPFVVSGAAIAIHAGRVDVSARFPLGDANAGSEAGVPYVVLIEAAERAVLERALDPVCAAIAAVASAPAIERETYDLAFTVTKSDLAQPDAARQPPRPDLHARW
jgi:hypothetical protein